MQCQWLAGIALLLFAVGCSSSELEIAPTWQAGDTWTLVLEVAQASEMAFGDSPGFSSNAQSEMWLDLEVMDVDSAGTATARFTYASGELTETITAAGQTMVPFAGEDGTSPLQKMVDALKGQSFTAVIGPSGKVTRLNGTGEIVAYLKKEVQATGDISGQPLSEDELDELTNTFAEIFDEDGTRETLEAAFLIYPGEPVAVGDSWTTESRSGLDPLSPPAVTTWTLASATEDVFELTFTTRLDGVIGEDGEVTNGSGTGTATLNRATGLPTNINGRIESEWSNEADGMTVSNKSTSDTTVELFR